MSFMRLCYKLGCLFLARTYTYACSRQVRPQSGTLNTFAWVKHASLAKIFFRKVFYKICPWMASSRVSCASGKKNSTKISADFKKRIFGGRKIYFREFIFGEFWNCTDRTTDRTSDVINTLLGLFCATFYCPNLPSCCDIAVPNRYL